MLILLQSDAKATDPNAPRAPPAKPRALVFPHYHPGDDSTTTPQGAQDLKRLFSCPERLVSAKHTEALNISISEYVPLDVLIPQGYLAPKAWLKEPSADEAAFQPPGKIHNNAPRPSHKDFYHRARELLHNNDLAFASLSGRLGPRSLPCSSKASAVRLTHTHKFYQNLLLLAEFWDTSKDNYIPASEPSSPPTSPDTKESKEMYTGRRYGAGHEMPPEYRDDTVAAFLELCIWPFRCTLQSPRIAVTRKLVLQEELVIPIGGISTTVCVNSPEREKARKGIVEGPLMGVHVRYYPCLPRGKKGATDKHKEDALGRGREDVLDLLHEVGDALLVAQKRKREGTQEKEFGKGAFWTKSERRHLGQLAGERQDKKTDEKARKEIEAASPKRKDGSSPKNVKESSGGEPMEGVVMGDDKNGKGREEDKKTNKAAPSDGNGATDQNNGAKKRRPNRPAIDINTYLDAKPPGSMWEPKVEYRMIGKDASSGYDHIYLLSSLNHHVSILHVPIHDRYLDLITNKPSSPPSTSSAAPATPSFGGAAPTNPTPQTKSDLEKAEEEEEEWTRLNLRRSK
ncbi:MAG: hypothetical protein Q9183_001604, partial [Haloplaca sp. 2 TL-2023]